MSVAEQQNQCLKEISKRTMQNIRLKNHPITTQGPQLALVYLLAVTEKLIDVKNLGLAKYALIGALRAGAQMETAFKT